MRPDIDAMKSLSVFLAFVLALQSGAAARVMTTSSGSDDNQAQELPQTSSLKAEVQKRGTGEKSGVRVTLRNGIQLKGHVTKIEDTFFEVTDRKGNVTHIPYAEAQKVQGPGLSKGAKIGIVAGVVVAITAIVFAVGLKSAGY